MSKNNKTTTGLSGEFFVAAELSRRGFTVAITMSNTKDVDILARNNSSGKQYSVQVKTAAGHDKCWMLSKKNESVIQEGIIYVMVSLNNLDSPEYHIVPSSVIASSIKADHEAWLATPGRKGQMHKDNTCRVFKDHENKYLSNWNILN